MGWGSSVFPLLIVTPSGGFTGLFLYSPGPGPGNLIGAWTAVAGTDPFGNHFPGGILSRDLFFSDTIQINGGNINNVVNADPIRINGASFGIHTAGKGLQVAEGANCKQGTATLAAGTVVVANTSVTAISRIFLTAQDNNSTGALRVSARTAGTSFTITSSNAADSGVVGWEIFEPG